ncbi:hypothetical protein FJV41_37580 [Myxococcus llanfairpwllgwyngyllgogerychwyrndrobwllllantysiliogogogochensis]|uniref:Cell wall surface anchor family protein n=1 Tax=Myxococcus llanfairpwllgwyngyllgogerychwyrndrobwllllantysiliogogogochensis TaxID=2590453 RepID=A0A540WP41_9BACT|nr:MULTISPECIES: hypothetical protein [unclassified Myxococcus]NTX09196.1 hypothetical protein [Myxococcus sp. CA056]NTX39718.1 hypothetical protein [Myxococcus sp. CA033]NTX58622.1 hypothetical protein [Myxococcus sp. CA039A]TQF10788.1 hypothetical protein FJV41_37580 [Myxococcus llanfairpwllgwyngyllgogerychwyrndrobwllllantysiliogogogochensis]
MAPIEPRPTAPSSAPTARPAQPSAAPPPAPRADVLAPPAARSDRWEQLGNEVARGTNGVRQFSDAVGATQVRRTQGPIRFGPLETGLTGTTVEGVNTRSARWAGGVSTAASVAQLPGAAYLSFRDVRDAFRNPSGESANRALGSVSGLASTGLNVAKGGLDLAGNVSNFRAAANAARTAFTQAAPEATGAVANRVATSAASEAAQGSSRQVTRHAAARAAGEGLEDAGRLGANAARTALQGGGTAVARAAGRFAPGLNVAIAAADTAAAASTLADPNAAVGKKVTAGVTALGSIAAATNIPVVSQAGAVVSTVSSFVGAFF